MEGVEGNEKWAQIEIIENYTHTAPEDRKQFVANLTCRI